MTMFPSEAPKSLLMGPEDPAKQLPAPTTYKYLEASPAAVYGSPIVRVTDNVKWVTEGKKRRRNDYSRRQAFNSDNTLYLMYQSDGYWYVHDAATGAQVGDYLPGLAGDAEPIWSTTDPNTLWYIPNNGWGMQLHQLNVSTRTTVRTWDLASRIQAIWPSAQICSTKSEGAPSLDGRYWCWQVETSSFTILGVLVFDAVEDRILGHIDCGPTERPDHTSMSPTGQWAVVSWAGQDHLGTRAYTQDMKSPHPANQEGLPYITLHKQSEHSDMALLPNGDDAFVFVDYQSPNGDLVSINMKTGVRTPLLALYHNGSGTAYHVSGRCYRAPGYVVVSTYGEYKDRNPDGPRLRNAPEMRWYHRKIFVVSLEANPKFWEVCFADSDYQKAWGTNAYWAEPHATVNADLTRILFNSVQGSSSWEDVETYMVALHPEAIRRSVLPRPPAPNPNPGPTPQPGPAPNPRPNPPSGGSVGNILIITPADGIWSAETQAKIRATVAGDTIRLIGDFELNDQFQILGGATRLDLRRAKVKIKALAGKTACFLLRNLDKVQVVGGELTYEAEAGANHAGAALYCIDCKQIAISNTSITGVRSMHGIHVDARTKVCQVRIQGCSVVFADQSYHTSHHNAIWLTSALRFADGTNNSRASAKAKVMPQPLNTARIQDIRILENEVHGGYYGIGCSGVVWGEVRGNFVQDNARGMSFQDSCQDLQIHWNHVLNNRSAGIHMAYGTHDLVVEYNRVEGLEGNDGEALIQAYIGTYNNTVRFNSVSTLGAPTHAFQGALGGLLRVENCTARVTKVAKALVASEQSWDPTVQQVWHSRANAPADASTGMEQDLDNRVLVNDCVFTSDATGQTFGVASDVRGGGRKVTLKVEDSQISVPGSPVDLAVSANRLPEMEVETPYIFGDEAVPQYLSTKRNGNRFESDSKLLQDKYGFVAPSSGGSGGGNPGGGGTPPPAPNPGQPTPPTDLSGTLAEGTKTKQLVAFITRPTGPNVRQYGDWIAFMEVENGKVVTWPESVDIPQWSGKRGFPAVILPRNGSIQSEFELLRRTYVELDGGLGYLGQHQGIKGVQWYARGAGMQIANENVTQVKTATGWEPVRIEEVPKTFPGTVGESVPSGVATFVWVKGVGSTLTCQFITVMGNKPVAHPDLDATRATMKFTQPTGFPAIVWPGTRLPADGNFRNLTRSFITLPVEASEQTGDFTVASSALSNANKAKLVLEEGQGDLQDSAVSEWYGVGGAVVPQPDLGGGISQTNRAFLEKMFASMAQPNDIVYPGWGNSRGSAQQRGGAVTMGPAFRVSRISPSSALYRSPGNGWHFDGAYTTANLASIGNQMCHTLQLWFCLVPGQSGGNRTRVQLRAGAVYVLEEGSSVWKVMFRVPNMFGWCQSQGPSMNPNGADKNSWIGSDPLNSNGGYSNGVAWIEMPTDNRRNCHGGHGDWEIFGGQLVDKSINYDKVIGIIGTMEARLAPGYEDREVAIQVGFDPKWPQKPSSGWWPGFAVSKLQRISGEWQTVGVTNTDNAGDSERGGITLSRNQLLATTVPGYR